MTACSTGCTAHQPITSQLHSTLDCDALRYAWDAMRRSQIRRATQRATSTALRLLDVALCRALAHRLTTPQRRPLNLEDCQTWDEVNRRMLAAGFGTTSRMTDPYAEARRILNAARKALR